LKHELAEARAQRNDAKPQPVDADQDGPDESMAMLLADLDRHTAEVERLRAELAKAEQERDETRDEVASWMGSYNRLAAEVQRIANACHELSERPIGHEVPERLAFAAG